MTASYTAFIVSLTSQYSGKPCIFHTHTPSFHRPPSLILATCECGPKGRQWKSTKQLATKRDTSSQLLKPLQTPKCPRKRSWLLFPISWPWLWHKCGGGVGEGGLERHTCTGCKMKMRNWGKLRKTEEWKLNYCPGQNEGGK